MIVNWLSVPENITKLLLVLVALNLMAGSTILLFTAIGQGPLYEALLPSVTDEYYILQNQYVGGVITETGTLFNVLVFDAVPLDSNYEPNGEPCTVHFENRHQTISYLSEGDIVLCQRGSQLLGDDWFVFVAVVID